MGRLSKNEREKRSVEKAIEMLRGQIDYYQKSRNEINEQIARLRKAVAELKDRLRRINSD